jgi:putative SOS response-associated peptidase YedK
MCGRFNVASDPTARLFMLLMGEDVEIPDLYNVAPTDDAPVVRERKDGREVAMLRWWLIPYWSKEPKTRYATFNARAESLERSSAFKGPFERRRCLVPISGFYEWQSEDGKKIPYYVRPTEEPGIILPGVWDHWRGEDETVESFTIVTTKVHEKLEFLHDRMPAMLSLEDAERWLARDTDKPVLKAMLAPAIPYDLEVVPTSTYVNNSRNKGIECLEITGNPRFIPKD